MVSTPPLMSDCLREAVDANASGVMCLDNKRGGFTVGSYGFTAADGLKVASPANLIHLPESAKKLQDLDAGEGKASMPLVVVETSVRTVTVANKGDLTLVTVGKA
mmetsp:Transcript_66074/g.158030  ORF Transcript_66074/g.158030 Transcript_66074/m.158030 type:complete len:105 (-) Transcript_66074:139-453(-)